MKRSFVHSPRKVFFGSPKLVITNDPLLVSGSNITYVIICILYSIYYIHQSIPKHKVNTTAPGFQNSVLGLDRFTCHVPHPCYPPESQPLASTPIKEQVHNWFKDIDIIYYPNLSNIIIVSVQGYYNVKLYIYISSKLKYHVMFNRYPLTIVLEILVQWQVRIEMPTNPGAETKQHRTEPFMFGLGKTSQTRMGTENMVECVAQSHPQKDTKCLQRKNHEESQTTIVGT